MEGEEIEGGYSGEVRGLILKDQEIEGVILEGDMTRSGCRGSVEVES